MPVADVLPEVSPHARDSLTGVGMGWLVVASSGLCWLSLWNMLRIDWSTNAQYAYAWSVPFIAGCLCFLRWNNRPAAEGLRPADHRMTRAAIMLMVLAYLPLRFVGEANGEWRMLFWIWELACAGISLGWLALLGGWPWARHFAFPVLFTAIAVPWPHGLEDRMIQALAHHATLVAVAGLHGMGIAAVTSGNLIHFANTTIGVNEACSGMKSFQTSLMLALLAGELWMLAAIRRLFLVTLGGLFSFVFNSARVFSLSLIAATSDREAFNRWHTALGVVEMILCIVAVMLSGWLLRGKTPSHPAVATASKPFAAKVPPPAWLMAFTVAVLLLGEGITEYWYRTHSVQTTPSPRWTVAAPTQPGDDFRDLKMLEIPEWTRAQLRTNDGTAFSWTQPDGLMWYAIFLNWPPGRSSAATASAHNPEVCLPANGFQFGSEKSRVKLDVGGIPMVFHHYIFHSASGGVHVFYSLSEPGGASAVELQADLTVKSRIVAALEGRRNAARAVLEFLQVGAKDDGEAVRALQLVLEKIVHPVSSAATP